MTMKKTIFCVLTTVLFLGGCASLPDTSPHSRLMDPADLKVGSAVASAHPAAPWPTRTWWQSYGDPQLDRLVAEATAGSPTLRMAMTRITAAQFMAGAARSELYPSVQADANFTRERIPSSAYKTVWENSITSGLSYNLDLWGKNRAALAATLDNERMAAAEAQEVQLNLETAVVRSYVQLSLRFVQLDIAKATLKQRQDILDITRKRFNAGLTTELDLRQAETPVPSARAEIERINEEIELLKNQLCALRGKGPGEGEAITRPMLSLNLPVGLPASLPADLLGRRPDVVAQRWRVEAAGQNIAAAKAAFYPNIDLNAFVGWQSIGFDKLLSASTFVRGFGPAISLPIFDGGRLRSQLGLSATDYDIAVESYNDTLIRALERVADSVVTLRSLEKQRSEATLSNNLAGRSYDIALRSFRAGYTDYLNVLNAQNLTLSEASRKATVEARFLDAYAVLMQELGGGMNDTPKASRLTAGKTP